MNAIKEYLLDPSCHPPEEVETYLRGECDIFAIAFNCLTGFQICGITEPRHIYIREKNEYEVFDCLVHAFCLDPENKDRIFDAKGWRDVNLLKEEYPLHNKCSVKFFSESELIDLVYKDLPFDIMRMKQTIKFIEDNYQYRS